MYSLYPNNSKNLKPLKFLSPILYPQTCQLKVFENQLAKTAPEFAMC